MTRRRIQLWLHVPWFLAALVAGIILDPYDKQWALPWEDGVYWPARIATVVLCAWITCTRWMVDRRIKWPW